MMREYEVEITETLQKTVIVEAETIAHAIEIATDQYNDEIHILDAEDFVDVKFEIT